MESKKYYKVLCKGGHVGRSKYLPITIYVEADNAKDAASIARQMPRVKHDHKDAILSVEAIDAATYCEGKKRNSENPYFQAKNIQQQRLLCNLIGQVMEDSHYYDRDEKKQQLHEQRKAQKKEKRTPGTQRQKSWRSFRGFTLEDCYTA